MAPLVSHGKDLGLIEVRAYQQVEAFETGVRYARPKVSCPHGERLAMALRACRRFDGDLAGVALFGQY
jgi:predicted alternative tryptophan synthase beta-subunit